MSIGRIVVDLLAKTGSFDTDLNRSAKLAERRAREIDAAFSKVGRVIGTALVAAAGAAAVAFKTTTNRMDELSKAAQRASMPTEDFSRLAYAADLADVSMQDLQTAFGRLARAQADSLKGNNDQARAFEALGISVKNADGSLRVTKEIFLEFADAFQRHQGSPEIMAVGMQLFGRSFQNLIPLLKDGAAGIREMGAEADAFGVTLSTQAGQEAERFNDNLTRLQSAAKGLAMALTADLLPSLNGIIERFLIARREGLGFLDAIHAGFAQSYGNINAQVERAEKALTDLQKAYQAGGSKFYRGVNDPARMAEDIREATAELEKLRRVQLSISGGLPGLAVVPPAAGGTLRLPGPKKTTSAPKSDQADLTDEQRTLIEAISLYRDIEQRAKDYGQTLQWLDTLYFDNAISTEQYDLAVQQLTRSQERSGSDGIAALEAQAEAWKDLIDPMRELIRNVEKVEEALGRGLLTPAQAEAIKKTFGEVGESLSELDEFALEAARNIQGALGDTLFNLLDGRFTDIGKSFGNMLKRMVAEAMAANLARTLMGDFAKTGKVGGWLGTLIGSFSGSSLSMRAAGGPVTTGTPYLVGERGPEVFVPNTSGRIVPNGAMGGVTVAPNIVINGEMTRGQEARLLTMMRNVAVATMADSRRRAMA